MEWIMESECDYRLRTEYGHEIASIEMWDDNAWTLKGGIVHDHFLIAEDLEGAKAEALDILEDAYSNEAKFCESIATDIENMQSD